MGSRTEQDERQSRKGGTKNDGKSVSVCANSSRVYRGVCPEDRPDLRRKERTERWCGREAGGQKARLKNAQPKTAGPPRTRPSARFNPPVSHTAFMRSSPVLMCALICLFLA